VRLSTAYWDSQTLLTANRLRIFDVLADGARSADDVAAALHLNPRATGLFLRACVALDLLRENGGRFENSATAATFLVTRSPAFMGNAIRYSDQLYSTWGSLEDALRSGRPALAAETYLGDDPARTRTFVHAMHVAALVAAGIVLVGAVVLAAAFRTPRPSQSADPEEVTPERAGIG